MSARLAYILAAAAGFTAVAMGAFGAHAVKARLSPDLMEVYETGSAYHLAHAVVLLALAATAGRLGRAGSVAAWCFFSGICVFSGSLYVLALSGERWLGAITPVGGVLLLIGWLSVGFGGWRYGKSLPE